MLAALLTVIGGGVVLFAGLSLLRTTSAFHAHAPLVAVEGADGLALLAGLGLLAIAAVCLTPPPDIGRGRSGRSGSRLTSDLMLAAAVLIVLSPLWGRRW